MMNEQMIEAKIAELNAIQAQVNMLTDQVEAIKDELKKELDTRKVDSISTASHNIFYNCYNKRIADTALLKKEGLYDKYSKVNTVIQFKITERKEDSKTEKKVG